MEYLFLFYLIYFEKFFLIHFYSDFLTINVDKKRNRSPNLFDMKKNIDNRNVTNSIKIIHHYRTKTLYNKLPGYYIKCQK